MKLITVAGPPSSGKTAVILHIIKAAQAAGVRAGVAKFDCISSDDPATYRKAQIPVSTGLSGGLCPDHFFVANIEACVIWGKREGFDLLVTESAGLCCRCSPHIRGITALCVIDVLSGVNTPKKIGPMLKLADIVVITKGDIVSQAEREVFTFRVSRSNPRAGIVMMNGLTGQGNTSLMRHLHEIPDADSLEGSELRFAMPAALCSYCLGETRVGDTYQIGNVRRMEFPSGSGEQ
ncbi:cobalamin synthesis protein, P47K [Methanoregula boonei 6A8]|jgi:Ni2+-binding GTPase involved in maturation of urease and hydrogenase|uniref:Cobalamin synthesis protein, P47K n=1 Tax=Methanoregula boonei (strain DSM 21154 / JCM 14090 / 6A8) TaxID=456442 RepID=A7IAX3_METB6|nr:GTP-binding protein [Methanoregula boonei]ABS56884.1 cobalamin synthesis protein, P47K [Methanoregula boonei 6A8]